MIVVSFFDGMSCGQQALKELNIPVTEYHAFEIDPYAITVTMKNHPNTIQHGDVTRWRDADIDWSRVDLILAGSPCQGFSLAGKQLAFDDPRSKLFFVWEELVNWMKFVRGDRTVFFLENVKMKKEHLEVINRHMGVEPVFINSALVCAQNRQRYYWSNRHITVPEDRGIYLKDILETDPQNITWMSDKFVNRQKGRKCLVDDFNVKASSLSAMEYVKNGRQGDYIQWVDRDKARALTTSCGKSNNPEQYTTGRKGNLVFSASMVGRKINPKTGKRDDYCDELVTEQYLEVSDSGKSRCLSTVAKDTLISDMEPGRYKCADGVRYRKLTPIECERLQGLPDNYTEVIENHSYSLYNYKETGNKKEIYLCDVKSMAAKEKQTQKSMVTYALCTTSDSLGTELLSYQKLKAIKMQSVNIAIEKLEKKEVAPGECVIDITKTGSDMVTLYTQIKLGISLGREVTKNALVVRTSTGKLLRIVSEESYPEMRLFTILIVIKLIIQLKICTYVTDKANIHYCINSLRESLGNLLSVDLLSLKMETTKQTVSNTQRYKMLGNGWQLDTIKHCFTDMFEL